MSNPPFYDISVCLSYMIGCKIIINDWLIFIIMQDEAQIVVRLQNKYLDIIMYALMSNEQLVNNVRKYVVLKNT